MATKKTTKSKSKKVQKQLHEQLVLNKYFLSLFDVNNFGKDFEYLKESSLEGYNDGRSRFITEIINRNKCKIPNDTLLRYDDNIRKHTNHINQQRKREGKEITWKYFQYLSILFVEIYLDMYFSNKEKLKKELNEFLVKFNVENNTEIEPFKDEDLKKIALWNATGSGKTLIMHMNILQYKYYINHYNESKNLNKIIILTPNEGLSNQHKEELKKSNIKADIFTDEVNLFNHGIKSDVSIIDLHKIRRKKGDKTVALDSFGTNNFVLIDEGHIGLTTSSSSDLSWNEIRNTMSEDGFCMEYSATFGQAIDSKNKESLEEYSKSIIFDYSYKYFYNDGYGKDYRILNMSNVDDNNQDEKFKYLVGSMLTFYQQLKLYNTGEFKAFNIEEPLMIFVGSKVNAVRTEKGKSVSDIVDILTFIKRFIANENNETKDTIKNILDGKSGINVKDIDIFQNKLSCINQIYRKDFNLNLDKLYQDVFINLFNSYSTNGILKLELLKSTDGEIALKLSDNEAFGVINVGDADKLLKLCEENSFNTSSNSISESLFNKIKDENSKVKMLIGSKKFTEGWDSWRVSCIGLMNMGKKEGSQIIQLFGRGVRLKGYNYRLKRSTHLPLNEIGFAPPNNINILETLNIFGINADYMQEFKNMLEREEVSPNDEKELLEIPILPTIEANETKKLKVIRVKDNLEFKKHAESLILSDPTKYFKNNKIIIDLYTNVDEINSVKKDKENTRTIVKDELHFKEDHLFLMDIDKIYFNLIDYKKERCFYNINITKDIIKTLLLDNSWYDILIPKTDFKLSFTNIPKYEEIAIMLLERYLEKFFKKSKSDWEKDKLEYVELSYDQYVKHDSYKIEVNISDTDIIDNINNLKDVLNTCKDKNAIKAIDFNNYNHTSIKFIGFDRHIYNPLISKSSSIKDIKITPVALNEGEATFVESLKNYYELNKDGFLKGKEVYLIRNGVKQVGFFDEGNFYPDFIMWIIDDEREYITFIDPKGMLHTGIYSEKVKLHETIKDYEKLLNQNSIGKPVVLNSFILSVTSIDSLINRYEDITKKSCEDKNILFIDVNENNYDTIDTLINKVID